MQMQRNFRILAVSSQTRLQMPKTAHIPDFGVWKFPNAACKWPLEEVTSAKGGADSNISQLDSASLPNPGLWKPEDEEVFPKPP